MTTLRCDRCPSSAFCSCKDQFESPYEFEVTAVPSKQEGVFSVTLPKAIPVEALGPFGARVEAQVRTAPAHVTPEAMAILEARIDQLGRALEADGRHIQALSERLTALEIAADARRASKPRKRPRRPAASRSSQTRSRTKQTSGSRRPGK